MDIPRIYTVADLVKSEDLFFAATGISGGTFLRACATPAPGPRRTPWSCAQDRHIRYIEAIHTGTPSCG
jgi:fructose-1,6-bisphosphatase II